MASRERPSTLEAYSKHQPIIKRLLGQSSPENIRHAELLALCQLDNWDRSADKLTIEDFLV